MMVSYFVLVELLTYLGSIYGHVHKINNIQVTTYLSRTTTNYSPNHLPNVIKSYCENFHSRNEKCFSKVVINNQLRLVMPRSLRKIPFVYKYFRSENFKMLLDFLFPSRVYAQAIRFQQKRSKNT